MPIVLICSQTAPRAQRLERAVIAVDHVSTVGPSATS